MQRRCVDHDYTGRMMYMVTMTTEGRRPLFGRVVGRSDAAPGSPDAPRTELSELGQRVADEWWGIPAYYPQVEILALQMMPDHLHGILFIKEQMEKDLSRIIRGFKTGCNRHFRALYPAVAPSASLAPSSPSSSSASLASSSPSSPSSPSASLAPSSPSASSSPVPSGATQSQPTKPEDRTHGLLFARGFNDKLLLREGQLQRWLDYLADNPRRLLLKRARPDLLRVRLDVDVCGRTCSAVGNLALLSAPEKLRVRISRSIDPALLEQEKARLLAASPPPSAPARKPSPAPPSTKASPSSSSSTTASPPCRNPRASASAPAPRAASCSSPPSPTATTKSPSRVRYARR